MNAYQKMVTGEKYCINDPDLVETRYKTRDLTDKINALGPREVVQRTAYLKDLFGEMGDNVHIEKPIRIDYGMNIKMGSDVFINFNWTVLDCCPVTIGSRVFIGPNTSFYTAHHPLNAAERAEHIGFAEPITIGNDVWIGGNVTILPGVTIGDGCVIGAGSLVTQDIAPGMIAVGSPCKAVKPAP
ncbi:sugar O-acetyltransferase [Alteromonas gilva]|uniref:Sugar O-acetyltransferase n=1 Tax=Alteromonas gilva TaxID=2987522 RepID=A0ABT5KZP8_9ALTE|nr:sugar O-acetyltransferase [Alteromonas gilva]MDC8830247.1 sugar O-acetyltransferase [Alteromonas gilva]